jgi:transposase-like protein
MAYTPEQRKVAVDYYYGNGGGYRTTCKDLGYPGDYHILKTWIQKDPRFLKFQHKNGPRRYSDSIKRKAITLHINGTPKSEIASKLKVHITSIRAWIKHYEESQFLRNSTKETSASRLIELQNENERLKCKVETYDEIRKLLKK